MIAERKSSLILLVLLIALILVYSTGKAFYDARGGETLPLFELLFRSALPCGVVWWLRAEAKKSAATSLYCPGLLATLAWIIIIPYHLIKTRGRKGWFAALAFFGSLWASQILGTMIYVMFFDRF